MHFRTARMHAFLQRYFLVVAAAAAGTAVLMCVNVHTAPTSVI